jgi:hypothetical protein
MIGQEMSLSPCMSNMAHQKCRHMIFIIGFIIGISLKGNLPRKEESTVRPNGVFTKREGVLLVTRAQSCGILC